MTSTAVPAPCTVSPEATLGDIEIKAAMAPRDRLKLLASIATVSVAAADLRDLAASMAELIVGELADIAMIDLPGEGDSHDRVAVATREGIPAALRDAAQGADDPSRLVTDKVVFVEPGDTLLLYTDGVPDTPGEDGFFGEQRLMDVAGAGPSDPTVLLERLDRAVLAWQRGRALDDRAMLALRLLAVPEPGLVGASSVGGVR